MCTFILHHPTELSPAIRRSLPWPRRSPIQHPCRSITRGCFPRLRSHSISRTVCLSVRPPRRLVKCSNGWGFLIQSVALLPAHCWPTNNHLTLCFHSF